MPQSISEFFASDGPLARELSNYVPRDVQLTMADQVADSIEVGGRLVVESGTGTGKTFAYLVPVVAAGRRALISTGTRHLQDQLFVRDLPVVLRALNSPMSTALLKGRANYLCLYRLAEIAPRHALGRTTATKALSEVSEWSLKTRTGDISELSSVADDDPVWPSVTSTADNCLGSACPQFEDCYLVKARREAMEADLVVINHHLFFADLVLREDGFGQLLPGADVVMFDEAHQLPDIAGVFLGHSFSTRQATQLLHDLRAEQSTLHDDRAIVDDVIDEVTQQLVNVRKQLPADGRGSLDDDSLPSDFYAGAQQLYEALVGLSEVLDLAAQGHEGINQCYRRAVTMSEELHTIIDFKSDDFARWFETTRTGMRLQATPLEPGARLSASFESTGKAWIFTSATLALAGNFDHFVEPMGLSDAHTLSLKSPFDYQKQSLMYLPEGLPDPRDSHYLDAMMAVLLPVIEASGGRAFLLFTSHRALQQADRWLQGKGDFNLLTQGSAARGALLERFVKEPRSVLLGTASFWEGVDVRGQALSIVAIDKLPFEPVNDPLTRARMNHVERKGANPFMNYQVPRAALALKQGVGRLIRDVTDSGVLILCDPRVRSKAYGRVFLRDLPDMPRTGDVETVKAFLAQTLTSHDE